MADQNGQESLLSVECRRYRRGNVVRHLEVDGHRHGDRGQGVNPVEGMWREEIPQDEYHGNPGYQEFREPDPWRLRRDGSLFRGSEGSFWIAVS